MKQGGREGRELRGGERGEKEKGGGGRKREGKERKKKGEERKA